MWDRLLPRLGCCWGGGGGGLYNGSFLAGEEVEADWGAEEPNPPKKPPMAEKIVWRTGAGEVACPGFSFLVVIVLS